MRAYPMFPGALPQDRAWKLEYTPEDGEIAAFPDRSDQNALRRCEKQMR